MNSKLIKFISVLSAASLLTLNILPAFATETTEETSEPTTFWEEAVSEEETEETTVVAIDENAAENTLEEDDIITDKNYDVSDRSAFLITGGEIILKNLAVNETGSTSAITAKGGNIYMQSVGIVSDCVSSKGLSVSGEANVYAENSDISVKNESSFGILNKDKGNAYFWNTSVSTSGENSPAVKIEETAGKTVFDGGKITTTAENSPAISVEGSFASNGATISGTNKDVINITGGKINLYETTISSSVAGEAKDNHLISLNNKQNGEGTSTAYISGGKITAYNSGIFRIYGCKNNILLEGTEIVTDDDCPYFIFVNQSEDDADCNVTLRGVTVKDDIITAKDKEIQLYLLDATTFSGRIAEEITSEQAEAEETTVEETTAAVAEEAKAEETEDKEEEKVSTDYFNTDVYIGFDSVWILSESLSINKLVNCNSVQDSEGKAVKIVDAEGKVLEEGESEITLTVNEYEGKSEDQKFSGAIVGEDYLSYKAERPDSLDYEPATESPTSAKIPEEIQEKLFENKYYVLIAGAALITLIIVCIIVIKGKKKRPY